MELQASDVLVLDGVSVGVNNESGAPVLRLADVHLVVSPGEWVNVVGVNGSGKSTLARLLSGHQPEGLVGWIERGFAGKQGSPIVLQQPKAQLFGETPREEIHFALEWRGVDPDQLAPRTEQALERTGLMAFADESWDGLSGGQQQLAAFAASTAYGAPLIILDEVTAMLDDANRNAVLQAVHALHKDGAAVVWVTQRLDELAPDSRVVALEKGRIIYDGQVHAFLFGEVGEPSPCERSGLRLSYLAVLALELRRSGKLHHPLPVTEEQWRDVIGDVGNSVNVRNVGNLGDEHASYSKPINLPLLIDGIPWQLGTENAAPFQSFGLRLNPGTITLLMGPNGVGKTTLLEKLTGLRPPEQTTISFGAEPLWQTNWRGKPRLNDTAIRCYSYACQAPEDGMFARTVRAELDYSLKPYVLAEQEREYRVAAALAAVGWNEQQLSKDLYLMSGGERRRAALASVFVAPAAWLLLDEPTAGLDGVGHEHIERHMVSLTKDQVGILLVSHDSDWALPLADSVMLLSPTGSLRLCTKEELLAHPEWLEEVGMQVPGWLHIAHLLWKSGMAPENIWHPMNAAQADVWHGQNTDRVDTSKVLSQENLNGQQQDNRINQSNDKNDQRNERCTRHNLGIWDAQENNGRREASEAREGGEDKGENAKREEDEGHEPPRGHETGIPHRFSRGVSRRHRLTGFDPRSVWLAYLLLSVGLFAQSDWYGIALGSVVVWLLLAAGQVSLRRWVPLIRQYVVFSISASGLFTLLGGTGDGTLDMGAFTTTLLSFARTMLVLLVGLSIPLVITPLSLRNSLEQMISSRGETPIWAQRVILTITLMLRFIPVLLAEWERFHRIMLARGKSLARTPWAAIRRLRDAALPFLLALFRLADEVVVALESRGVGLRLHPTRAKRMKWRWRDYGLVAGVMAITGCLWMFANRVISG